jgi:fucose permease
MGLISQHFQSLAVAYSVPLAAYIFIAYYSFFGSQTDRLVTLAVPQ